MSAAMTKISVAALQLDLSRADSAANIEAVSDLVAEAAHRGADLILPPELFDGPYFCKAEEIGRASCRERV